MIWIIGVIAIAILFVFIKFLLDYSKQRSVIESKGGVLTIYRTLINGLLEYQSARIIQNEIDLVTVGGTFVDPIYSRECGLWSVIIQPTFKTLNVQYQAHTDLGGGESSKKMWDFPISMSQDDILKVIKKKADEWETYGILK